MMGTNVSGNTCDRSTLTATRLWISAGLDAVSRDAFEQACIDIRTVRRGNDLVRPDTHSDALHILINGWAARYKILEQGARFISALAVPGDICNLDALRFDRCDQGVTMITAGTVAVLPRQRANALFTSHPPIAAALCSLGLVESSILMERAASIGRRAATHRVAHLLCELLLRLTAVGKAEGLSYDLPLTQELIADALGLTAVHVNRTIRSLRSRDLVTVQNWRVTIHDWAGLSTLSSFDPGYLHLQTIDEKYAHELPTVSERGRKRSQHQALCEVGSFCG